MLTEGEKPAYMESGASQAGDDAAFKPMDFVAAELWDSPNEAHVHKVDVMQFKEALGMWGLVSKIISGEDDKSEDTTVTAAQNVLVDEFPGGRLYLSQNRLLIMSAQNNTTAGGAGSMSLKNVAQQVSLKTYAAGFLLLTVVWFIIGATDTNGGGGYFAAGFICLIIAALLYSLIELKNDLYEVNITMVGHAWAPSPDSPLSSAIGRQPI